MKTILLPTIIFILILTGCDCPDCPECPPTSTTTSSHTGHATHKSLGTHGCVPKTNMIFTSKGEFYEFPLIENRITYYYIPFDTVFIHDKTSTALDTMYSPAYFRCDSSVSKQWLIEFKKTHCDNINFGIGICSLKRPKRLEMNSVGMYYFEDIALFCDKSQIYPKTIDKDCRHQTLK